MQSPGQYYESVDLRDAFHPQTLIAYALNGKRLDVPHGAPLRLRVERQLGYKQAKYVQRIEITDSFANIAGGKRRLLGRPRLRMVCGNSDFPGRACNAPARPGELRSGNGIKGVTCGNGYGAAPR